MPYYIILWNWTQQGIKNIKDSPKRAAEFREAVEKAGGKVLGMYYTFGQYDGVIILEGTSDEAALASGLATVSQGNVRSMTLKAFTDAEVAKIIERLP